MQNTRKYKTIQVEVYNCERCKGDIWFQRPIRRNGKTIKNRPKNCTHCKSPSWFRPRDE